MTMLTKPTPPPKYERGLAVQPASRVGRSIRQHDVGHYQMPMRDQYVPEWRAVLRDVGYPTTVVVLDFETYFDGDYSMRGNKLSTIEYIMDDRFENLGVSSLVVSQPFPDYENWTSWWTGEAGVKECLAHLQQQFGSSLERATVVAQNAAFDGAILAFRYGIHPPHFIDTLGLARHWNSRTKNDLKTLAKRYGLPDKGETADFKEATFRRRMKRVKSRKQGPQKPVQLPRINDEQLADLKTYANNDVMREWELFTLLLPKMSLPKTELRVMQHTLELFWKPSLLVDSAKGEEIKAKMEAAIDRAVEAVGEGITRADISGETTFEALLEARLRAADPDNPLPLAGYTKIAKNKKGWKFAIAKDDRERETLENHPDPAVRTLIEARNAVKSWPLHIARIDRIIDQARAAGGKLPVPLKYHGAHTGRWSGGEKINLQNLGSRGDPLVSAIREMLVAPSGYELVIADASQIEARVLAWIAGQWDLVQKFGEGAEIYCRFAEKVLDKPEGYYRKPKADGIPAVEKRHKWARNIIGKVGVLGCGYGMGPDKAIAYSGGELDVATAEKLVQTYRSENDKIKQFWHDIERAFTYTLKYRRACELPRGLRFEPGGDDCDVIIVLPNGRELKYHTVRLSPGKYGDELQVWNDQEKRWGKTWGGSLTENVVQAMSRDILWEAIARLESEGHHVALHVHDELIAVVPEGTGQKVLNRAITHLSTRPDWASECPLAAEGLVSPRYGGH